MCSTALVFVFFATVSAALENSEEKEQCGTAVQSHALLQRKHDRQKTKSHKAEKTNENDAAPTCEGVDVDGRCWYLSDLGESCESVCLKHGRSFKFKTPVKDRPMIPKLLNKDAQTKEGDRRAFECYKPEEDHFNMVNYCSTNDYRDNQGSWSDAACQLACPCGGVKECRWKQPEACTPVFMYKEEQYTGCPKVNSDRPWCSHDHDNSDEWSHCVYECKDASANGATEMFSDPPFPEKADDIEMTLTETSCFAHQGSKVKQNDVKSDALEDQQVQEEAAIEKSLDLKTSPDQPQHASSSDVIDSRSEIPNVADALASQEPSAPAATNGDFIAPRSDAPPQVPAIANIDPAKSSEQLTGNTPRKTEVMAHTTIGLESDGRGAAPDTKGEKTTSESVASSANIAEAARTELVEEPRTAEDGSDYVAVVAKDSGKEILKPNTGLVHNSWGPIDHKNPQQAEKDKVQEGEEHQGVEKSTNDKSGGRSSRVWVPVLTLLLFLGHEFRAIH